MKNYSTEVHGGGGLELLKLARDSASWRPKLCASLKNAPRILPVRRSLLALVGRKHTAVRDQFSPHKRPGSSTIELLSALAEAVAYSPNGTCHGMLARAAAPYEASRVPPPLEGHQIGARKEVHRVGTILNQPNRRRVSTDRLNDVDSHIYYLYVR